MLTQQTPCEKKRRPSGACSHHTPSCSTMRNARVSGAGAFRFWERGETVAVRIKTGSNHVNLRTEVLQWTVLAGSSEKQDALCPGREQFVLDQWVATSTARGIG